MRIIVCGGRNYADPVFVEMVISKLPTGTTIITGGAKGADTLAHLAAVEYNMITEEFFPGWKKYGNSAGPRRNKDMLDAGADYVIAFEGGRGTAHMVKIARKAGVPVWQPDIEFMPQALYGTESDMVPACHTSPC